MFPFTVQSFLGQDLNKPFEGSLGHLKERSDRCI